METTMNVIKIECPQCQQRLSVGPEDFGLQAPCPVCKTMLAIPHPEASAPVDSPAVTGDHSSGLPGSVKFLGWYYAVAAVPFILFALFGFTIPAEDLTNHPEHLERDRGFLTGVKILIFGGMLLYASAHAAGAVGLLRGRRWGYRFAWVLSILGILHLNPFAIPGLVICLRKNVREFFA